jgi:type IV secretory pathway VirB9-like protein
MKTTPKSGSSTCWSNVPKQEGDRKAQFARANEQLRPVRVFDDGSKTYIQMRADIQNREASRK